VKLRHDRPSHIVALALAVLVTAGCAIESAEHRRARLSAIERLAEIRARLPQFHEDSLVRARDANNRVVFRAWFDGPQLAILHEEVRFDSGVRGRDRFYLVDGALLACSTSYHRSQGTYRDMETAVLFDAKGHPLIGWVEIDGRRRFPPARTLETIRAMNERTIHEFWDDYASARP
jgi:hypothetical protein